jgi:hypothetical protein
MSCKCTNARPSVVDPQNLGCGFASRSPVCVAFYAARVTERFELQADGLGRYTIDASLPAGGSVTDDPMPVILVTDGNILYELTRAVVHGGLNTQMSVFPRSLVVGVSYPDDEGAASYYARRNYDFHGTWDMQDEVGTIIRNVFADLRTAEGRDELGDIRAGGY